MIIKNEICKEKKIECKNIYSCKYLQGRFGVKECDSNKKEKIKRMHEFELENRYGLMSDVNPFSKDFCSGDNYKMQLDKNYIDYMETEGKQCK